MHRNNIVLENAAVADSWRQEFIFIFSRLAFLGSFLFITCIAFFFGFFFSVLFWQFFGRNLSALEALRHWDTEILGKCGDADKEKTDATGEKSDGETGLSGSRNSTESAVPQPKPKRPDRQSHPRLQHHQQHHPQKPHHSLFRFSRDTAFFSMQNSQIAEEFAWRARLSLRGCPQRETERESPKKERAFLDPLSSRKRKWKPHVNETGKLCKLSAKN